MNKKLLSLACAGAFTLSAFALSEPGITEVWVTPSSADLVGKWDMGNPPAGFNWSDPSAIAKTSNPRFAAAANGKVYTVNQKTMAIAEVQQDGTLKDIHVLANIDPNFYGTAIAVDEAGNFLVGEDFLMVPESATKWTVCTKAGQCKQFDLGTPDWTIGRTDCVSRVLGDLTKEAIFFIAPSSQAASKVRVVKVTGDGSINSVKMETLAGVDVVAGGNNGQNTVVPGFNTYAEYVAAGKDNYDFYYLAPPSGYTAYVNGETSNDFAPDLAYSIKTGLNGFDTFTLGGKRYYVRSFAEKNASGSYPSEFQIAVLDENGDRITSWKADNGYVAYGGYMSIMSEVIDETSANIYVYISGNSAGAAACLLFEPANCGAPVMPERPVGTTPETAYRVTTPSELSAISTLAVESDLYVVLENDLDFNGETFKPISVKARVHFDGQNHVIKNIYTYDAQWSNWGLFTVLTGGEVKNLGLVNSYHFTSSGCAGCIAGEVSGDVTIDNCYSTGTVYAGAGGGLIGTVTGKATITNSYSLVNISVNNAAFYIGGLVGRVGSYNKATAGSVTVKNSYAGGLLSNGVGYVGGLVAANNENAEIVLEDVFTMSPSITGAADMASAICAGLSENVTVSGDNVLTGLMLNGVAQEGKTAEELLAIAAGWGTFNDKFDNGNIVLAWEEANGNPYKIGTKENPHKISTPEDLAGIRGNYRVGDNYFSIENDIDMEGVAYTPPLGNSNFAGMHTFIEGNNHIIKNLSIESGDYPSLIGVFMGEIRNLGLENVEIVSAYSSASPFGCYVGHVSYDGTSVLENCFATGSVTSLKGYAGGLGGYNNGKTIIKNCYAVVDVVGTSYAGGIYAWLPAGETTIENVYVAGNVEATAYNSDTDEMIGYAAGAINLVGNPEAENHAVATLNNVAILVTDVYGGKVGAINGGEIEPAMTNVSYTSDMLVNEESVEGGVDEEDLINTIKGWDEFSATAEKLGYPMLKWEAGEPSGISDIVVDEAAANGPAVYYNLQGVRVVNPENGIYIVRRGDKVSKELVR